jgi:hypothetical protein
MDRLMKSASVNFSSGVPLTSVSNSANCRRWRAAFFSRSTSVSHGRSVSPFHWARLAFS